MYLPAVIRRQALTAITMSARAELGHVRK